MSLVSKKTSILTLEELVTYSRCPLQYKYTQEIGRKQEPKTKGILDNAVRRALSQFFVSCSMDKGVGRSILDATDVYRRVFEEHGKEFNRPGTTFDDFNNGVATMQSVLKQLTPHRTEFLFGSTPGLWGALVEIDDTTIANDIIGMARIREKGEHVGTVVVDIGIPSREPTAEDYLRHGFWHQFMSDSLKDQAGPKYILYVDIEGCQSVKLPIDITSRDYFRAIARSCIAGINNKVWLAWPELKKCAACPYTDRCSYGDCTP